MPRAAHVLRVFTKDGVGGNHLGVVNDYTGLDADSMQGIASDLGFSESTFVDWQPGEVPFVRIFTPEMELPFAGHPLVGTAHVMGRMGPGGVTALRCAIGEVTIEFDGDATWIHCDPLGTVGDDGDLREIAEAASIPPPVAAHRVMMPLEYLIFLIEDDDDVAGLELDLDALGEHFGVLVGHRSGDTAHVRFFAPTAGVPEDPATGSAAVALAAVLRSCGEPEGRMTIHQGEEMGHPSRIELSWTSKTTSIGGTVEHDETRFLET